MFSSERGGAHVTITVANMTADHMTPDEWRRVKTITAEALDRPASERLAFVTAECGSNDRLRDEVWSLLVASDKAATASRHNLTNRASDWWS